MPTANPPVAAASHPLDPLTAREIEAAAAILRRKRVEGLFHLKPDGFFDGNPALDVPPAHLSDGDGHHHGN